MNAGMEWGRQEEQADEGELLQEENEEQEEKEDDDEDKDARPRMRTRLMRRLGMM